MHSIVKQKNQKPDEILVRIANYVFDYKIESKEALETAKYCLIDTLGCGLEALDYPACVRHLGPTVPGSIIPNGTKIPGTNFQLDPINGAFNIGAMIRWLDFNDTWLAAEWGHPSDNLGGILAVADWISRTKVSNKKTPLQMKVVLEAMIKAHEIQGIIALENSFNRVGLDHVVLVKIATTAVVSQMLGASKEQIIDALSNAWVDGQSLRTYRHAPNTGSRKSWAAGDATSRGVRLALMVMKGEMGYPTALSAKGWGFYDVLFNGKSFKLKQDFGTYVMENVLFKISFPAEFHAQTAVEGALKLHKKELHKIDDAEKIDLIERIDITTHESAIRIIDKTGPLNNPADRDHCIQYMVAIALLKGNLTAQDYEDEVANDPRIDILRAKMRCNEKKQFTLDYLDPSKRSIANAVQIFYKDGSQSELVEVEYPVGHKRRRSEGMPKLIQKFKNNLSRQFDEKQSSRIVEKSLDNKILEKIPVNEYVDMYWKG